jgi:hypothetical protein
MLPQDIREDKLLALKDISLYLQALSYEVQQLSDDFELDDDAGLKARFNLAHALITESAIKIDSIAEPDSTI